MRFSRPPYGFARDAIARIAVEPSFRERIGQTPEAANIFLELLTHAAEVPLRRGSILGELHEVGLMLAMIPEFEPVTGRVQHDVYHVYTVDVHSVAAIDRLRALMRGDLVQDLPLACRLAAEAPRPVPLYLGLLLHDIGKAQGKDHSVKGASMARPIAERLGLSPVDVEHVVWLVREHLSFYHWATRRDTTDPETIAEIARGVATPERLRDLYLLTVADLSTTNPHAMTSWKARMLEDLYVAVLAELEGTAPASSEGRARILRKEVQVGFVGDAGREELEAFLGAMPDRYVLANPVDVIRQHARVARDRGTAAVAVSIGPGPSEDVAEVMVVTDDRSGLLADITAVLAANRLGVQSAQIYTRQRSERPDEAFDIFHVRSTSRAGRRFDAKLARRLERDLEELLAGRTTADALLERVPKTPPWAMRKIPDVPTEVTVDNEASPRFTVVDVYTRDRAGLLHVIARTLSEQRLSIGLSKVSTEGHRVADVFYVLDASGEKVRDPERLRRLRSVLRERLERFDAEAEQAGVPADGEGTP